MQINATTHFYPAPDSLYPLPSDIRTGLLVIGSLACTSLFALIAVLSFVSYRFINWKGHYKNHTDHNQCVILVFNLLLADLFQSLAFGMSFHWYFVDGIYAPTPSCWAQASFLNFADVASGGFVLGIAVHTAFAIIKRRRLSHKWFVAAIVSVWCMAILMTIVGPLTFGPSFYARAGNWVSQRFRQPRHC